MKKIIKVIACATLAGCMLVPLAGCSDGNYQSEIDSLQAQIKELESKLDTPSDNSELLEMLSDLQSEISALKSQINDLKGTNSGLNTEITALKSKIEELKSTNSDLNTEITSLQSKIEELKSTNSGLNTDITALQNKINELKSVNSQLEAEIASLQGVIDELQQSDDLFTGSPKFNYEIDETIPYYINGTKIFDFKINEFVYSPDDGTRGYFTVTFYIPTFDVKPTTAFSAVAYNASENKFYEMANKGIGLYDTSIAYYDYTGSKVDLTLFYYGNPFAIITATPSPAE